MIDYQCTYWPDVWFGISLTDCCVTHDLSRLDLSSSIDLGVCAFRALATVNPVAGAVVGTLMAIGTAVWCGIRHGPRGKRDP
ncbi:hypothetical protein [Aureimonas sp. ME7]|uniref:hypothetical protein n=1 Tax=Aureimonas sp. ME7 TaxID=2744252 RepID=UPI0015FE5BD6|nr:hypothetical protein [Aureimonas sp. ME7]